MLRKVVFSAFAIFLMFSCSSDSDNNEEPVEINLPSISTIAASSITSTSAEVGGNATNDGGGTITAKGIVWGTAPNPTISGDKTTNGKSEGEFSTTLSGLKRATQYYFRSYASNSEGTAYGNEMTFTTNASLAVLSTNEMTDIKDSSAISGGVISDDGGTEIISKGICWDTNANPTIEDNITEDGEGSDEFVSELNGLSPNTAYFVRAYVVNSEGVSYGNEITFTTNPALASLTTKEVTELGQISAIGGGVISSNGGAEITSRGVCWSTDPSPTIEDDNAAFGSGIGEYEITLQDLTPNTQYYVRAYATNEVGTAYGNEISIRTLESSNNVFDGDIVLLTQQEVDEFGAFGYDEITGSLSIGGYINGFEPIITDITNLNALSTLEIVGSSLEVINNDNLSNFEGLLNIKRIGGDMRIVYNDIVLNMEGFDNLVSIGGTLFVGYNDLLQNVKGFDSLSDIEGDIHFNKNNALTNFIGFENITVFNKNFQVDQNFNVQSFEGLEALKAVKGDFIATYEPITSFDALSNLEKIDGGLYLTGMTEIVGFDNLISVGGLGLGFTNALVRIGGFSSLVSIEGNITFSGQNLEEVKGFESLEITTIRGNLSISNTKLQEFDILNGITQITGNLNVNRNQELSNLNSLSNIISIGGFFMADMNTNLTDYCSLQNLLISGGLVGDFIVRDNAYNPTEQNIINGNCSN